MKKTTRAMRRLAILLGAALLTGCWDGERATTDGTAPPVSETGDDRTADEAPQSDPAPDDLRLRQVRLHDSLRGWAVGDITLEGQPASQVWRTEDGGAHWQAELLPDVTEAVIDFADERIGWAAGRSDCAIKEGRTECEQFTVLRTTDGGESWIPQSMNRVEQLDGGYDLLAVSANVAYVRAGGAVWKTINAGQMWSDVSVPLPDASVSRLTFVDESAGYAGGTVGACSEPDADASDDALAPCRPVVWRTTDGGETWTPLLTLPQPDGDWRTAGLQFVDRNNGYLLLMNLQSRETRLYRTQDGGDSWSQRTARLPGEQPVPVKLSFVSAEDGWIPLRANAGSAGGGLIRTRDGCATFDQVEDARLVSVEDADRIDAERGWLLVADPERPHARLLLSTADGGRSWEDRTPPTAPHAQQ